MANRMIIDASHPEETRVVVLRGNRVEEFDFESASKRPLRGNIYLAKVTRVEPSLQAAFVDYGGNRHGFLAFSEIHPDYYQIPVADRQALLEEEALSQRNDDEEPNGERRSRRHRRPRRPEAELRVAEGDALSAPGPEDDSAGEGEPMLAAGEGPEDDEIPDASAPFAPEAASNADEPRSGPGFAAADATPHVQSGVSESADMDAQASSLPEPAKAAIDDAAAATVGAADEAGSATEPLSPSETSAEDASPAGVSEARDEDDEQDEQDEQEVTTLEGGAEETLARARKPGGEEEGEPVEQVGGDAFDEAPRRPQRLRRQYKIQEVIKRRQVLLVQVVKEERGNKGAALTTYLSLAGRYSVLMPNTARGGGISRKITDAQDRNRLKSIAEELDVPEGMGVILRTAGATRTKAEVKRDFEYLLRMWETVRETTLASSAPTLVYEEGSLIKRAIRDLYSKDVEEITVADEAAYREARQFMRLLMPSHVNSVRLYRDTMPVFAKAGVEAQLDAMFSNQVTLKSGGYIVINQTEALVAIDVNSGRSTREHNIEDTALRTNLEAADEIARQLRLRDLAGLIVVDFIDMEESRNNRAVERRIKDALKNDRARIQVGRISHFGLLEMSRQRIRTGVLEGSTIVCPHCQGAGVVRSTASIALHVLRVLEDALIKSASHDVVVRTRTPVALYILNQKRANLRDLERRFGVVVTVEADDTMTGSNYHAIERGEPASGVKAGAEGPPPPSDEFATIEEEPVPPEEEVEEEPGEERAEEGLPERAAGERMRPGLAEEGEGGRRRRRRRRRRGGERPFGESVPADAPQPTDAGLAAVAEIGGDLMTAGRVEGPTRGYDGGDRGRRRRQRGSPRPLPAERDRLAETADDPGEGARAPADADREFMAEEGFVSTLAAPEAPVESPAAGVVEAEGRAGGLSEIEPSAPERPSPTGSDRVEPELSRALPAEQPAESRAGGEGTAAAEPEAAPPPAEQGPPRPRRTGWWQRARASIVGD